MPDINKIEIHSEEVQEIMGHIPGWIIRRGMTLIFTTLIVILTGSYFFKYPEIVSVPVYITFENPEKTRIYGKAYVPSSGMVKVRLGQEVNIKLAAFNFREYGMLPGIVRKIYDTHTEKGYPVEIDLPEGMKTTYAKELKYFHEMDGTADIITDRVRVLYKLISPLKGIFRLTKNNLVGSP